MRRAEKLVLNTGTELVDSGLLDVVLDVGSVLGPVNDAGTDVLLGDTDVRNLYSEVVNGGTILVDVMSTTVVVIWCEGGGGGCGGGATASCR